MGPRVGVIGAGVYGTTVLQAFSWAQRCSQIELTAVAEIDEDVLGKQAARFGVQGYAEYRDMLQHEDLDAVAIVTPDHLHREMALACAERGIHTMVQKPLDVTTAGASAMVQAARDADVLLYVDFHKRFDPGHVQLRRDVRRGKLGRIQYGYVWMEDKIVVPSVWFKDWAQHSSPAWFLGVHFLDLLYWILGAKPERVLATGVKDKLIGMGIDTYDSIQAKIEYANGAHFSVDCSWILPDSFPSIVNQGIRMVGSEGIWEVDSQDRGILYAVEEDAGSAVPNYYANMEREDPQGETYPAGYVIESMLWFLQLVSRLKQGATLAELDGLYPNGEEALVSTRLCEAIHKSLAGGHAVAVEL